MVNSEYLCSVFFAIVCLFVFAMINSEVSLVSSQAHSLSGLNHHSCDQQKQQRSSFLQIC